MKVEKIIAQSCCGGNTIVFKLDKPVSLALLDVLKSNGFRENSIFTKMGMLYADNPDFIVTGQIGMDRFNIKCKKGDYEQNLNDFEALLVRTG